MSGGLRQIQDADLHLLRVFVAVAECGGMTAAQSRLNVASSTISTQIANLESRLGARLCQRGRRGFQLTDEGREVLTASHKMFAALGDFMATMNAMRGSPVGTLRIVLLDNTVGNPDFRLGEALSLAREKMPFLQYQILQKPPGDLETAVLSREADVGISWIYSSLPGLHCTEIFMERQVICCGRKHPLFEHAPDAVDQSMLDSADWVRRGYRLPRDFPYSQPPISSASVYHMESVLHFVLAGTHIGYLPFHYVQPWVTDDLVRPILPDQLGHDLQFKLITRQDRGSEPPVATFSQILNSVHG